MKLLRKRPAIAGFLCALSLALEAAPLLLSEIPAFSISAAGNSFAPIIAPDGSYVVFVSAANNLVTNDGPESFLDVFIHDLASGNTRLLSTGTNRIGGRGNSLYPQISSNGLFVTFSSEADELRPHETNLLSDVFLHNLAAGTNALVSTRISPGPSMIIYGPPILGSSRPVLTPNGRWIAFESTDPHLVPNDTNRIRDIIVRDMLRPTNMWVSVGSATNFSFAPSINADGSRVAFLSTATGLQTAGQRPFNPNGDIYVRDVPLGKTYWASSNVWYLALQEPPQWYPPFRDYSCFPPVISANGSIVTFKASRGINGTPAAILKHHLQSNATTIVASNCLGATPLAVTPDGRFIAYELTRFRSTNIFLCDTESGTHSPISVDATGALPTNGVSKAPVITPDGRAVAFLSTLPDLVSGQTNGTRYQLYLRDVLSGTTRLISYNTNGEPSLNGVGETVPSLSADGRRIVFDYAGADLVAGDNNEASDVFLCDLDQNQTSLISRRHANLPSATANFGPTAERVSASADGRFVAFTRNSNGQRDCFVADQETGSIVPLSLNTNGQFTPNYRALQPLLSADGRYGLFLIHSNPPPLNSSNGQLNQIRVPMRLLRRDLVAGISGEVDSEVLPSTNAHIFTAFSSDGAFAIYNKTNGQLWHADFASGTTRLLVTNLAGEPPVSSPINPLLSPNDRWVVFQYRGTDLTTNPIPTVPTNPPHHLFAYDLLTHGTFLISSATDGSVLPGTFTFGNFDAAGGQFVFSGIRTQSSRTEVYLFDFNSMRASQVCSNCSRPYLSHDGRSVLYRGALSLEGQIVMRSLESGASTIITLNRFGQPNSYTVSSQPLVSRNGRYVVFQSMFNDFVGDDANRASDIFVRDLLRCTTQLISANRFATSSGNAASLNPFLSRDGNTLIFQSFAGDLTAGDYNYALDLFSVRLGADDTDNDGLDDDWEMAFFLSLDQGPSGDFDADSHTNLEEFLADTDPTDIGSILQVLVIRKPAVGSAQIIWSAVAGRDYIVQHKSALNFVWSNLSPVIKATSSTAAYTDQQPNPQRFYRVLVLCQ